MSTPFPLTTEKPGQGCIDLARITSATSILRQLSYQYPLKLIAPSPLFSNADTQIQTVYLLTYGGGLVAGDTVNLTIKLDISTRLILLTQGSTKIFKSPSSSVLTSQSTTVEVSPGASLCYLPDPVQPFERSCFEQTQQYNVHFDSVTGQHGSLCVLDWVSQGRTARGENWDMRRYASRNDVWLCNTTASDRLLLRDNLIIHPTTQGEASYSEAMHGMGVVATLILHGPLFASLATFFRDEFGAIPRVGGRKWDSPTDEELPSELELQRGERRRMEEKDGLLWTVASLRGCTVVKFGAREVEGAKRWLKTMLESEGSVVKHFGERALLCLK